jgi:Abnormal spindle-like microcephaly-assoc'd, ASPM-SPD-2-Hydin
MVNTGAMPSPRVVSLLPVFRPLVVAFTLSLLVLITAGTATSATQRTRWGRQTLAPSSSKLAFGNIPLGNSLTQFETLTNAGNSTVTISQAAVTGPGFGVSDLTLPASLSKGQSVTFRVLCTPLASGNISGTIAVVSTAGTRSLNIALSAAGVSAGQLTSNASTFDFGGVAVGTSKSIPATLTATGSGVTISSATSTSAEFGLSGISLPTTIAAGQTVSLTLTFTPQTAGTASGTISFGGTSSSTLMVESLTGSGTAPSSHAVDLRWNPSPSDVVGYNVYRASASGGPYTRVNPVVTPSTSYVDNSVQGGTTYYYVSTSIESSGSESEYSNQMQAVIPSP